MNPAAKSPERRAGHRGGQSSAVRVLTAEPTSQPKLPSRIVGPDGKRVAVPASTRRWWTMWGSSPLAEEFTETDWSELLDTAVIHARFWLGEVRLAAELRLRVAKFGATPEDRARLRVTFAKADDAEHPAESKASESREQYGPLQAVPSTPGEDRWPPR